MKQLYTLEEIHRYSVDVSLTEQQLEKVKLSRDTDAIKQLTDQVHIMREVLQRMHENLDKWGPLRPSLIARWIIAWEIGRSTRQSNVKTKE